MSMKYAVAAFAAACSLTCAAQAATITVYNATQLSAAVKNAAAGDTIKVAPGNYGDFEFKNINPASAITVIASNSANLPVFTNLKVTSSSNLKITRLVVDSPAPVPGSVLYGATISRSDSIRFSGMVIHGVLGGGVSNDPRGLRITNSTNVTIAGNSFTELTHGILVDGSSKLNISDNGFTGIRVDGIMADGATGSTIARNRFSDFRPEGADHADAIQLFNNGVATINLTISDNLMLGGANGQMQGIFLTNSSEIKSQLDQVKISNNLMWGTMYNGIAVYDANRVSVTGNTLFSNTQLDSPKTWVRLEDIAAATATGNYAGAYLYTSLGKLTESGNVLSVLDLLAAAAVATWDATHSAAPLSLPYYDPDELGSIDGFADAKAFGGRGVDNSARGGLGSLGAVPEPASWAMMIGGFGLIGAMRRRLQRRSGRRMARG
jgi:parallel beta-helix repeat protein